MYGQKGISAYVNRGKWPRFLRYCLYPERVTAGSHLHTSMAGWAWGSFTNICQAQRPNGRL